MRPKIVSFAAAPLPTALGSTGAGSGGFAGIPAALVDAESGVGEGLGDMASRLLIGARGDGVGQGVELEG
jgi:hypothetical protein